MNAEEAKKIRNRIEEEKAKRVSWAEVINEELRFSPIKRWSTEYPKSKNREEHLERIDLSPHYMYLNFGESRTKPVRFSYFDIDRLLVVALALMDQDLKLTDEQRKKILEKLDSITNGLKPDPLFPIYYD